MAILDLLQKLRSQGGEIRTRGLPDDIIQDFAGRDPRLMEAVEAAVEAAQAVEYRDLMGMDEIEQVATIQAGITNFYQADAVNPYATLAARGPWLVTTKLSLIHI